MFAGRNLLIASKHKKERVIAPMVVEALGIKDVFISDFDTDSLGTFSGEISRKEDPITTLRNKCLKAMKLSDSDLAIASEGSFGPHPTFFFCAANEEFIILGVMDKRLKDVRQKTFRQKNKDQT